MFEAIREMLKDCRLSGEYKTVENKDGSMSVMYTSRLLFKLYIKQKATFYIKNDLFEILPDKEEFNADNLKSMPDCRRVSCDSEGDLYNLIIHNIKTVLDDFIEKTEQPSETFGCCMRYTECSDAKICLHPNKQYSRGCIYRTNLEKGLIFYGKNKNIE